MGVERNRELSVLVEGIQRAYDHPQRTVREAQKLARMAHRKAEAARKLIDRDPEGRRLRLEVVDPLLARERELEALRQRLSEGGARRAVDRLPLETQLVQKVEKFKLLKAELPWESLDRLLKFRLSEYVQWRRREIRFGDPERVLRECRLTA